MKFSLFKLFKNKEFAFPPVQIENADKIQKSYQKYIIDTKQEINKENKIFFGLKFFVSREVNKDIFEFLIKSFDGEFYYSMENFDSEIFKNGDFTHIITERVLDSIKDMKKNVEVVQP